MEQTVGYLQNAVILVSLVIICVRYIVTSEKRSLVWKCGIGLLIGIVSIGLRLVAVMNGSTYSIDSRAVLIFTTALYLGWVPAAIATIVILIYRIFDTTAHLTWPLYLVVAILSVVAGLIWRRTKKANLADIQWWHVYLTCSLLGIINLMCGIITNQLQWNSLGVYGYAGILVGNPMVATLCSVVISSFIKRVDAENQLREQETYYHDIYEHVKVGICQITHKHRYLDMNQAMAELVGFTNSHEAIEYYAKLPEEEFLQRLHYDFIREALSTEPILRDYHIEVSNVRSENKIINLTVWTLPELKDGETVYECVAVDVTKQELMKRQLEESESKYHGYVHHSPVGIFVTNRDLQYVEVNPAACRMTGYTEQELLGMTVWQIFAPSEMMIIEQCKQELLNDGISSAIIKCLDKSGAAHLFQIDTIIIGEDRILGLVSDLTDILQTKHDLEAQRQMTINLIDTAKSGFWEWNFNEDTVFLSPGFLKMLGYTEGDLPQDHQVWPMTIRKEDYDVAIELLKQHVASHGDVPYHLSMRLIHHDGHEIWIVSYGYVIDWNDDGTARKMVGSVVDISSQKEAEEEVRRLNEQLEERLADFTRPNSDTSALLFTDLFDLDEIQTIQDTFAKTSNVASIIVDEQGYRITKPSNYTALNNEVINTAVQGRQDIIKMCDHMIGSVHTEPYITHAMNGCVLEGCVSIMVEDRPIATWMFGQVLDTAVDEEKLYEYVRSIGADEFKLVQVMSFAHKMSQAQFEDVGQALQAIADQLSRQAIHNAQQARFIAERRLIEKALRESENRYSQLFSEMTDAFVVGDVNLDADGNPTGFTFTKMNNRAESIFGVRLADITGKNIVEMGLSISNKWIRRVGQVAITGDPVEYEEYYKPTNCYYSVRIYRPEPMKFAALISDITSRVMAEKERKLLQQRIEQSQKFEGLGVLAGGIAHDFNNILMAIMGNTDIALLDLPSEHSAVSSLEEIKSAVTRAAELCRQMLVYAGHATFNIQTINMSALAMELVELSKASVSKKIVFHLHIPKSLPMIMGDDSQIRQVIMNLIVNAAEAIGEKSGTISLSARIQNCTADQLEQTTLANSALPGDYLLFGVADNGCGMDESTIQRLFEPFFTTKFTGRGLGMSSVLGIIKGHRGTISVQSELNVGTTIVVYLPLAEDNSKKMSSKVTVDDEWRGDGTVLLVDDESTIRDIGRQLLSIVGFHVITAADGREALELYHTFKEQITLVLLDMTMPDLDGVETYRALRRMDPNVKVIISSGYTEQDVHNKFKDEPVNGFIAKPYTLVNLREQLYKLTSGS